MPSITSGNGLTITFGVTGGHYQSEGFVCLSVISIGRLRQIQGHKDQVTVAMLRDETK